MTMIRCRYFRFKSRSDDLLLTVGFNLRIRQNALSSKSCKDDTLLDRMVVQVCRLCGTFALTMHHRRLKPAVNNMTSLREYVTNYRYLAVTRHYIISFFAFCIDDDCYRAVIQKGHFHVCSENAFFNFFAQHGLYFVAK